MTPFDENLWTEKTAARLKQVQASLADAPAETRIGHLRDALGTAVAELRVLGEAQRSACLVKLEQRFPVWGSAAVVVAEPRPAAPAPASTGRQPQTAAELLNGLMAAGKDMPRAQLALYAKSLRQAGFVELHERGAETRGLAIEGVGLPESEAERLDLKRSLEQLLKLLLLPRPGEREVKLLRCMEVLNILIDRSADVENGAWDFWQKIAVRTGLDGSFRRELAIKEILGDYLTGSPDVTLKDVTKMLKETFDLVSVLAPAMQNAGSRFATDYRQQFGPAGIKQAVELEPASRQTGRVDPEARCWRKYCELMDDNTESAMDERLQELLVQAIIKNADR